MALVLPLHENLGKDNTHTDWHILCNWNTVFFAAFRCKNDISFNIHNWVCLKMTPKNTPEK